MVLIRVHHFVFSLFSRYPLRMENRAVSFYFRQILNGLEFLNSKHLISVVSVSFHRFLDGFRVSERLFIDKIFDLRVFQLKKRNSTGTRQ